MIDLAVFDVAGTTVDEGGTVYRVLADTVKARGADPSAAAVQRWMGASKREAIAALLAADGITADGITADDATVDAAFADFRSRLTSAYAAHAPRPFAGVPELFVALRERGVRVALSTGFDRGVTGALLAGLGWVDGSTVDAVVCIDDVPAGRPAPYLIHRAMERTGVTDVRRVLAAGDTVRDVEAGRNAGASLVVAVTSGHVPADTLAAAGPDAVLASVVDVSSLLDGRVPAGAI